MYCKCLLREERDLLLDGLKEDLGFATEATVGDSGLHKIGNQRYHSVELESHLGLLFTIAVQKLKKAEDVLHFDVVTTELKELRTWFVDFLKATRSILESNDLNFNNFKDSILHLTDLDDAAVSKLIAARQGPLYDYLHIYLDLLWMVSSISGNDVQVMIRQLSYFSYKCFERGKPLYICDCFKKLWLQIQVFCSIKDISFWGEFNQVLESFDAEFCLLHLHGIAKLQSYGIENLQVAENIDFLNVKWGLILKDVKEDKLMDHFEKVDELLVLWLDCPKLDMIYTTWDFYYKRIESFEVKGNLIEVSRNISKANCGYTMFLKMLYRHLDKHQQWNKFRGRIYTRFSNARFAKLSSNGVFNISLLFAVLCPLSSDEILKKLGEMLDAFPEQITYNVWNLQINLIQLQLENNKPVVSKEFLNQLAVCSQNRSQFNLIATFANQLESLMCCSDNMHLNQRELFGAWIQNYMKHCQVSELSVLLNVLILAVERIVAVGAWYEYEKCVLTNVLAPLKKLATNANPIVLVGTLSALIAVNNSTTLLQTATFFASEAVSIGVMLNFFATVSKTLGILTQDIEGFVLKVWFQCGVIGETNGDLNKVILELESVRLRGDDDPLMQFIESLSRSGNKELVKTCFSNLDAWISKHLSNPLYTQHIYTFMAIIFNSCGKLLYSRSSVSNHLSKYIDILLLPTEVLRGLKPADYILGAIERTWHLYVNAIHSLAANDPYLERIFKDLVVRYLVHFKSKPSPLIKLIGNERLVTAAFAKINREFFLQGVSRANDEQVYKAIQALTNLLESADQPEIVISNSLGALLDVYMFKNQKPQVIEFLKAMIRSEQYKSGACGETVQRCLADVTKKHLPFSTSTYFQMCFVLTKLIPGDLRLLLGKLREEIGVVERKRGQGFDNSLRQGLEKLRTLLAVKPE